MDVAVRSLPASRAPTFLALDATVGARRRPAADERIDIPEVQQSTRVSFSNGAVVHGGLATRSPTDMYRAVQQLASPDIPSLVRPGEGTRNQDGANPDPRREP